MMPVVGPFLMFKEEQAALESLLKFSNSVGTVLYGVNLFTY